VIVAVAVNDYVYVYALDSWPCDSNA